MSAMRKMGVYLGLVEDAEGTYDEPARDGRDQTRDQHRDQVREQRRTPQQRPAAPQDAYDDVDPEEGRNVAHLDERRRPQAPRPGTPSVTPLSRITTLHPRTYNEARVIGENFRDGVPVIMNLSEMADEDAKRLVDFAAGLVFSVRGTIERVTNKVFLLSPPNVSVAAEDKQRIAEGGFFNQS